MSDIIIQKLRQYTRMHTSKHTHAHVNKQINGYTYVCACKHAAVFTILLELYLVM